MFKKSQYVYNLNTEVGNRLKNGETFIAESKFDLPFVTNEGEIELYEEVVKLHPKSVYEFGFELGHRLISLNNIISLDKVGGYETDHLCLTYGQNHFKLIHHQFNLEISDIEDWVEGTHEKYDVCISHHRIDELPIHFHRRIIEKMIDTFADIVLYENISQDLLKEFGFKKRGSVYVLNVPPKQTSAPISMFPFSLAKKKKNDKS